MKTPQISISAGGRFAFASLLFVSAATFVSVLRAEEVKDHALFVGTDLSITKDGKPARVVGATDDGFIVDSNHERTVVPYGAHSTMAITRGVKLSNLEATVSNLKTEQVDRAAAWAQIEAMKSYMILNEESDMESDRKHAAVVRADLVGSHLDNNAAANVTTARDTATADFVAALDKSTFSTSAANTLLTGQVQQSVSTGLEASFEVSSPRPLHHPYLLLVSDFSMTGNPGHLVKQVTARSLDHIDGTPQKVRMYQSNLPQGAELKGVHVDIYAEGQEVATNLSERRTAISKDEAYQFFLVEYLLNHKGETRPPTPLLLTPKAQLRGEADLGQLNRDVYAAVDKNGALVDLSSDPSGSQKAPAYVVATMQNFRFIPAIDKGMPVEGKLKLNVAELIQ